MPWGFQLLIILTSEICIQYVNSIHSHHDLSHYPPPLLSQEPPLPPGQLDLVLSHPPGQLFLSQGCQFTELVLKCPVRKMLIVESARFIPAKWNPTPDLTKLNCSSLTKHSEVSEGAVISNINQGDKDIRQALNMRCAGYSNGE